MNAKSLPSHSTNPFGLAKRSGVALFILLSLLVWVSVTPAEAKPMEARESATAQKIALVEGFRSARFGMTEVEVRKAIEKDFQVSETDIQNLVHPSEKTTALSIAVSNILEDSGPARVSYILGYKSKRLIQVNVIWGNPVDKNPNPKNLISTANSLRSYFSRRGFKKDDLVMNARLADGSVLVFRGSDGQGRMVILLLKGPKIPQGDEGEKNLDTSALVKEFSLRLSYISNPQNPDIHQIKEGQF